MNTNLLGLGIGAGAGALLGGYVLFPSWRNRQTNVTPAMVTWLPYVWTIGAAVLGAGVGYLVSKRVRKDAAETRPRLGRERNEVYYGGHLSDSNKHIALIYLENKDLPQNLSSYLVVFPLSQAGERGIRAWSPSEGHTSVSREYLRSLKIAKGLMAQTVLKAYTRQHDDDSEYQLVTTWPRKASMSDADCTPRKRTKRSGPRMSRSTKTIKIGTKTVRVSVLSDGTYVPTITATHPAVQSFIAQHPRFDKEVVLLAAESVATKHGDTGLTPGKIHDEYGALRLPFSLYTSLGKNAMMKQASMTLKQADAFESMIKWAESESSKIK